MRSKLPHQHQDNHKDCPYIFVLRTNPNRLHPIQTFNLRIVGANLVFALFIFVFALLNNRVRPYNNRVRPFFICACTKQIGLRAETGTRLCECE